MTTVWPRAACSRRTARKSARQPSRRARCTLDGGACPTASVIMALPRMMATTRAVGLACTT
eukprot:9014749-Lingulodinium_polyedra.AAC.1